MKIPGSPATIPRHTFRPSQLVSWPYGTVTKTRQLLGRKILAYRHLQDLDSDALTKNGVKIYASHVMPPSIINVSMVFSWRRGTWGRSVYEGTPGIHLSVKTLVFSPFLIPQRIPSFNSSMLNWYSSRCMMKPEVLEHSKSHTPGNTVL
jgi:hypothetical protein